MKWTPGAQQGEVVAGGNGGGSQLNQLYYPAGAAIDLDGNYAVADFYNHRIMKWTPGEHQGELVAGGNGKGANLNQLHYPQDVKVCANGNYIIVDYDNHRIVKWAPGAKVRWSREGMGRAQA